MSDSNKATIEAYNNEVDTYILRTPHEYQDYHKPMLDWINAALENLEGVNVFEIGSATPRDATYMRSKGFTVQTSDVSERFVQALNQSGEKAILFDALEDDLPSGYSLVFANAVAPHFTPEDLKLFLAKMSSTLSEGQRLAFNLKIGDGESWINEKLINKRFIHYWQPEDIKQLLADYADLKVIFFDADVKGDLPNHLWVNMVLQKV